MNHIARQTFETRMAAVQYRPSGFDYMRIILAVLIVCAHTIDVTNPELMHTLWRSVYRPIFAIVLPMFFCLSGFLVAGSFIRCKTVVSFAGLRLIRLVPALAVDTLVSAIILGPIFTLLTLPGYFSDPRFFKYFSNIIGHINYVLPGVFEHNPVANYVNLQLWTLPFELKCYLSLIVLAFLGIAQRKRLLLPFVILVNILLLVSYFFQHQEGVYRPVDGNILVVCFLFGICAFLYKDRIVWSRSWMLLSLCATVLLLSAPLLSDIFVPIPATYLTVYLGLLQPRRTVVVSSGDFSYGVFLYGFPVQQALYALIGPHAWYTNLLISLPVTVVLAMLSWHLVEKPALRLRASLLQFEAWAFHLSGRVRGGKFVVPTLGERVL